MDPAIEHIRPETLAMIESRAEHLGISADEYIRGLLPPDEQEMALRSDDADDEFERDMAAFGEGVDIVPVYDGTYSREDIYADHD